MSPEGHSTRAVERQPPTSPWVSSPGDKHPGCSLGSTDSCKGRQLNAFLGVLPPGSVLFSQRTGHVFLQRTSLFKLFHHLTSLPPDTLGFKCLRWCQASYSSFCSPLFKEEDGGCFKLRWTPEVGGLTVALTASRKGGHILLRKNF